MLGLWARSSALSRPAGVDLAALVEPMNFGQAERQATEAGPAHLPDHAGLPDLGLEVRRLAAPGGPAPY